MKIERLPKWTETELPHGFLLYIPGNLRKEAPAPADRLLSSEQCAFNCTRYLNLCSALFSQESASSLFSYLLPCLTLCLLCACVLSLSAVSDSLWPYGLWPAMLLCPWDSPGKNTGENCHFLFQGIFSTHGSNPHLLWLLPGIILTTAFMLSDNGSASLTYLCHLVLGWTNYLSPRPYFHRVTSSGLLLAFQVRMRTTAFYRKSQKMVAWIEYISTQT